MTEENGIQIPEKTNNPRQTLGVPLELVGTDQNQSDTEFFQNLETKYQQPQPQQDQQQTVEVPQQNDLQQQAQQGLEIVDAANRVEEHFKSDTQKTDDTQTQEQPETPQNVPDLSAFEEQFKTKYGIELQDAVNSAQQMTQFTEQLQQIASNLNLRMQKLDLMQIWNVSSTEVDARVDRTRRLYNTLSDDVKRQIQAKGTQGLIELYDVAFGNNNSNNGARNVPAGRATIASNQPAQVTPELLSIKDDREFFEQLGRTFNIPLSNQQ